MLLSSALCASHGAEAQFRQQGPKLVGTGAVLNGYGVAQGNSVAISGDGNTAIVGGPVDNANVGAVWAFTRSGGVWIQQGPKLVGSGAVQSYSGSQQGYSVAISGDGNTAIVGGPTDAVDVGSVWVFTRSGDVWSQQGPKLTGVVDNGSPHEGHSVAISADGNTAIVGGPNDEFDPSFGRGYIGATWVFTRSSGGWTQQGPKLVATQSDGPAYASQGYSVAISADGNTAIVGGPGLREYLPPCPPCNLYTEVGAAWVFISQRRFMDAAGQSDGAQRRRNTPGLFSRNVGRRKHGDGWRGHRDVGLYTQRRGLDAAGRATDRRRRDNQWSFPDGS